MEKVFDIFNLDCAHCGAKIEAAIKKIDGVDSAVLNFPMKKLRISGDISDETMRNIVDTARKIEDEVEFLPEKSNEPDDEDMSDEILPIIIGVILLAAAAITRRFITILPLNIGLYAAAYLILGADILKAAAGNIRSRKFFDENTLMTIATLGAFALGEFAEAVGVVLFFRIGELFEDFAVARSRKAISSAAGLKVSEADVLADGEFRRVAAEEIKAGDILRVKTGERIAADGVIESGESRIDTSAVNGEPVPLTVRAGDSVMSGCINLAETFTMKASAAADDSMIAKIAEAVEEASCGKPKIDRFITRFARIYTPVVIAAALATAVIPSLITGDWEKWIYSALTFLVISCPCALVLSVPLAYFSGIGAASKLGILFKGGDAVEALGKVKAVAFDKTGTLTNGSFSVTEVKTSGSLDRESLLKLCGSCEENSTHPVAESITGYCRDNGIGFEKAEKVCEYAGRGISAVVAEKMVFCGSERFMRENDISITDSGEESIGSVVYVAVDGVLQGKIIVSDSIKESSAETVAALRKMGIHTAMLTGDKAENAEAVGKTLGIETVKGGLLPAEKLEALENIRSEHGKIMFVGDGINDAPVLAGADVGGAVQSGADLALEAADIVLMNQEPETVVKAKKIADKALRISYENIAFALAVKAAVLVLGILGIPSMWFAVFADSGTAMLLILNSVRVLNTRKIR